MMKGQGEQKILRFRGAQLTSLAGLSSLTLAGIAAWIAGFGPAAFAIGIAAQALAVLSLRKRVREAGGECRVHRQENGKLGLILGSPALVAQLCGFLD